MADAAPSGPAHAQAPGRRGRGRDRRLAARGRRAGRIARLSQASLRRITPTEFAVTSTLEPALAAVAAAVFLGVTLRPPQYAGGALTILAVLLLAPASQEAPARGRLVRALPGTGGPPVCCDAGMDFDTYARKLWTGRADAYERGFARLTVHAAGPLLDAAGVSIGARVLDVGTGPGVVAGAAAARGATVTAVDAEPSMIEAAARNVPGLDVRLAVLPDLPLPDGEFDAVTGNFVIHATGDPAAVLAELRRVLRPGGRLALTCWNDPAPPVLGIAREAIDTAGVTWPPDVPVAPFHPYSSPGAFAGLLAAAGFAETAAQLLTWEHRTDPEQWWDVYRSSVGSRRRRDRTAGRRHHRAHQDRVRPPGRAVRHRRRHDRPARRRRPRHRHPPLARPEPGRERVGQPRVGQVARPGDVAVGPDQHGRGRGDRRRAPEAPTGRRKRRRPAGPGPPMA